MTLRRFCFNEKKSGVCTFSSSSSSQHETKSRPMKNVAIFGAAAAAAAAVVVQVRDGSDGIQLLGEQ